MEWEKMKTITIKNKPQSLFMLKAYS